ncbi:MAG TPA: hypothetical protein GX510_02400 [Firmicutes bacterium]|nr:hypothetical protein [Candidatus Fermentithermobacillaceae bacterium]
MTQYQITLSDDMVHRLFKDDVAMARLLEQVLNQVLQAEVTEIDEDLSVPRWGEDPALPLSMLKACLSES